MPGPSSEAICHTSIEGALGNEAAIVSRYSTARAATLSARSSPGYVSVRVRVRVGVRVRVRVWVRVRVRVRG